MHPLTLVMITAITVCAATGPVVQSMMAPPVDEYRLLAENYALALSQIKACPTFTQAEYLRWIKRALREREYDASQ